MVIAPPSLSRRSARSLPSVGWAAFCVLSSLAALPSAGQAQCLLCEDSTRIGTDDEALAPLSIQVETSLDFNRLAIANPSGGSVTLDPFTGNRSVSGGLVELGGMALQGVATVRGEPGRPIRLQMPQSATLHSSEGGSAELTNIVADLPKGGARLGPDGTLRFTFGGRLNLNGNAHGDYRGRILLVVDYQ